MEWSPEHDVFCSVDGKTKSYCTPEAYHGSTCWLFRNRGNGTFEDVTAKSGIFDTTSKSLGVAMLDYDHDGWPDLFVANDTQPNKLYRNRRDGTFEDVAVRAGVAFSEDRRGGAGMGVDAADFDNSGGTGIAITNFDDEMIALYRPHRDGTYEDAAMRTGVGQASRMRLGFGCAFLDANLDGHLDLAAVNGHIDETVRNIAGNHGYAQPPHLFLNDGKGGFHDQSRRQRHGAGPDPKLQPQHSGHRRRHDQLWHIDHISESPQLRGRCDLGRKLRGGAIGNRPENFVYFGMTNVASITLSGNSTFVGAVYAPEATLTLNGGGNANNLEGSAIVNSVTLNGHYDFHYDVSLAKWVFGPARGYIPLSWQEL